jgi:hypothetical protein
VSTIPTWLGATAQNPGNSGQVNQFLAAHNANYVYTGGVLQASATTGISVYDSTDNTWLSQSFVAGSSQTTLGSVLLQISTVGGSPVTDTIGLLQVALYADSSGFPTGSPLATISVPETYVYSSPFWVSMPLVAASITPGATYHIVVMAVGTVTNYYAWQQSNTGGGAATSPDGVSWTAQAYGLMYQVYDLSGTTLPVLLIYEDDGTFWTAFTYNTNGTLATVEQFAVTQSGGALQSSGTLAYSNGLVTGVS